MVVGYGPRIIRKDKGLHFHLYYPFTNLNRVTTNKRSWICKLIKRKILIVDDEYDITFVFKIILEESGFTTDVYNDPTVALLTYKPYYYDLVMVDLKLPGMTGFE